MAIDKNYAPKLYCSTANMTEEEWENERRKALGGSDMAVVLGMSPFEGTRLSVYNEKIGKKAVEPMSDKTRVIFDSGHFLENMVADLFSYRTGYETYEVKAMFEHNNLVLILEDVHKLVHSTKKSTIDFYLGLLKLNDKQLKKLNHLRELAGLPAISREQ